VAGAQKFSVARRSERRDDGSRAFAEPSTRQEEPLVPVMMAPAPVTVAAVEPVATVEAKSRTVITTKRWTEGDAEANWRKIYDRSRRWWRRIIVTGCWSAVRLNHICAGVRARSSSKPECQHCQCHHETFFSHDRRVPPDVWPI
jgi:hypothetical protein